MQQTVFLVGGMLFFVFIDQITKLWARKNLGEGVLLCNDGIALGVAAPRSVTVIVTVIIIILLCAWFMRHRGHALVERVGLALLIAGGSGNLIDRVYYGCVTDFVAFFGLWHFNIADALIAAGVALLLWHMIVVVPAQGDGCHTRTTTNVID